MKRTLIVAPQYAWAKRVANEHHFQIWQWKYAHSARDVQGYTGTILVHNEWTEPPQVDLVTGDDGVVRERRSYPMTEALRIAVATGSEIVYVTT